jgi:hypothetical protein
VVGGSVFFVEEVKVVLFKEGDELFVSEVTFSLSIPQQVVGVEVPCKDYSFWKVGMS